MIFETKTDIWKVSLSNDQEEYEMAWISYNADYGDVEVQFAGESIKFASPEQFESLFEQVMLAIKKTFEQNKGKIK